MLVLLSLSSIMQTVLHVILFAFMLGILVALHELGHFLTAKLFKVYVFEFAIGMGPKIVQKKGKETYYTLRAFPIGGYVSMLGEEDGIPDDLDGRVIDMSRSLARVNRGKRAVVMSAGIVMNIVLGALLFLIGNTLPQTALSSRINVTENSQAYDLGLRSDDYLETSMVDFSDGKFQIIAKNAKIVNDNVVSEKDYYVIYNPSSYVELDFAGQNIVVIDMAIPKFFDQNKYVYAVKEGDAISFSLQVNRLKVNADSSAAKEYETFTHAVTLSSEVANEKDKTYQFSSLGFSLTTFKYHNSIGQVFEQTGKDMADGTTFIFRSIRHIFGSKDGLSNVSGPIGILSQVSSALTNFGVSKYLYYWGLISIQLAIFNLLPFPGLDGWHLLVITIEAISRREMNKKFKNIAAFAGMVILIGLMILIAFKDVITIFR